ncbi:MAG: hypothetical protein Phog2KO_39290 [Phototrophicaceae bacterium]
MTTEIRDRIRSAVKPFPRKSTYSTSWNGEMTFEEVVDYVSPLVVRQYKRYGMYGQDIPDALQNGLMQLWQELVDNPNFLTEQSNWDVVWHVVRKSKSHLNQYYRKTKIPFTDIEGERGYSIEEYGLRETKLRLNWWDVADHHARFTHHVDFRLDITSAMEILAEEYEDDMKGLIALYILTTEVEPMETIATFGHPKSMVYERIKGIRDRLQRILEEYELIQPRTWQERLADGEVEPYLQVVEHYQDLPIALFALYTLTTDTKVKRFAKDNKQRKMIFYYRKKCLKSIEAVYGQAASF